MEMQLRNIQRLSDERKLEITKRAQLLREPQ